MEGFEMKIISILILSVFLVACNQSSPTGKEIAAPAGQSEIIAPPNSHIRWTMGVVFSCPVNYISKNYPDPNSKIMTCVLSSSPALPPLPNPLPTDWAVPQPNSHIRWSNGVLFCDDETNITSASNGTTCTQ